MKKVVSGIVFMLLLTGMLSSAFIIQPVEAEWTGTVYIRADGSIDPADAPIITYDNVTYTLTDNIRSSADGIVVERDNIIIDGAGCTLEGTGAYGSKGIDLSGRTNVTVWNTQIKNFDFGIWLYSSSNNTISGNNITNNGFGIRLYSSSNYNSISGNNIANNDDGIWLYSSSNNTISGNNITNNGYGIGLSYSSNNTISGNNITANNGYGIWLSYSSNNTLVGNNIANNWRGIGLSYYSNYNSISGNNITANNDDGILLVYSSNNTISGNNIANNWRGIGLSYYSNYNSISGNNITANNDYGIWLVYSSNNSIVGNNITANNGYGIWLSYSSNNTLVGNVFVDDGLLVRGSYGNAVVDNVVNGKPLVYLEEASDLVVGDAGQVILIRCSNITVENLNLSNTSVGIQLWQTNNTKIANNIANNNRKGIRLYYSSNNSIVGNNITANNVHGIWLDHSSNNSIVGNNITANNVHGIWLDHSSNNSIVGNNITANNVHGIWLDHSSNNSIVGNTFTNDGLFVWGSYRNVVEDNTVNGKPLVYLEGVANYSVGDAGQVILVNCTRIRVENLNLSRTDVGIQLWKTSNTIIQGNKITANSWYGIVLGRSSNNTITGNNIANNGYGIQLYYSSNNTITGNNIASNGIGIDLWQTNNTKIANNNITANNDDGIWLYSSSNNTISGNNITANNGYGIQLSYSSNNTISGNTFIKDGLFVWGSYHNSVENNTVNGKPLVYLEGVVDHTVGDAGQVILVNCTGIRAENLNLSSTDIGVQLWKTNSSVIMGNNITNNGYGIRLVHSSNNSIYHNNFVNNTYQISNDGSVNVWDDGYPSGGNYWSDYNGIDIYSGPDQDMPGSDGIGDVVYEIDADNRDLYPLMAPFNTFDAGVWNGVAYNVDVVSNSTLSNFQLNTTLKTISFNVTGVENTAGFCRITIPNIIVQDLWQGNYTVLLNGESWSFRNWTDNTNTYIYVNYTHSEHQIIIIPEFPSAIILPLFMILSVIVLVLAKKKRLKKTQT